jgi:hypothetical protein
MAIANITGNILTDSGVATSSLLPLTGGTLTGALNGTSATFSSSSGIGVTIIADWNRSATNDSQLYIKGATNGNKQLRIGYDTTGNAGYIQALTSGTSVDNLLINPSGGNVGIGTSSPSNAKLEVKTLGTGAAFSGSLLLYDNSTYGNALFVSHVDGNSRIMSTYVGTAIDSNMTFWTTQSNGNQSERMRITSGGNVGINGFDTGVQLYVKSTTSTSSDYPLYIANTTAGIFYIRSDGFIMTGTAASSPYNNTTGSGANLFVSSGGVLQRSTSSLKYKTDVIDYDKGLAEVMQMRPVYYKGKTDGDTQFAGLIAEEIHDLGLSEFVQYAEDGSPDALYYQNMIALLTKAIQELSAKVLALENKS